MSIEDHRSNVKNILNTISPRIDDGVTFANVLVMYQGGPENLKPLFYVNDFDAVITVGRPRTRRADVSKSTQDMPLRYNADVPVTVCAVDKTGVTATKLLNNIRHEINDQVEAFAQRPGFTLFVDAGEPRNNSTGGYDPLWMDEYVFRYRPMEGYP